MSRWLPVPLAASLLAGACTPAAPPAPPGPTTAAAEPAATSPSAPRPSPNDCAAGKGDACSGPPSAGKLPQRRCTDLPCLGGLSLTRNLAPNEAKKGKHTFQVELDGAKTTCLVDVVDLAVAAHAECPGGYTIDLGQREETKTEAADPQAGPNAPSVARRVIVPNSTHWKLSIIPATPKSVRVVHAQAGKVVSDRAVTPTYAPDFPNGNECGSSCSKAQETVP